MEDIAAKQKRLMIERQLIVVRLNQVDAQLREINRPKHIDGAAILAEMAAREKNKPVKMRVETKRSKKFTQELDSYLYSHAEVVEP